MQPDAPPLAAQQAASLPANATSPCEVPRCYEGTGAALPTPRILHAGSWSVEYHSGELRYLKSADEEIVRRWYAAVRDANWGTPPGELLQEHIEQTPTGFVVSFTLRHCQGEVDFTWQGAIRADDTGRFEFTFAGVANRGFLKNRIGFCLLHPVEATAGQPAEQLDAHGRWRPVVFAKEIAPYNPAKDLAGLRLQTPRGTTLEFQFQGDLFETEDQRNWMDASFKTFCTPLSLPFPVRVEAGDRVEQRITLQVRGPRAIASTSTTPEQQVAAGDIGRQSLRHPGVKLQRPENPATRLPELGLRLTLQEDCLPERVCLELLPSQEEVNRLRALQLTHVRADLAASTQSMSDCLRSLEWAIARARELDVPLELALTVPESLPAGAVLELTSLIAQHGQRVLRWLLFPEVGWGSSAAALIRLGPVLRQAGPVYAGTTANFTEFNRQHPAMHLIDGGCFSVQPQEHAFDSPSLAETCTVLGDIVHSARSIVPRLPLAIGPITLKKRVNPYATTSFQPRDPQTLPTNVDLRQTALFGAGWTLSVIQHLTHAGLESATLYETLGWRGVLELASGTPLPAQFPSCPGMTFPLYHVLQDVGMLRGRPVWPLLSEAPLQVVGLQGELAPGRTCCLVANLRGNQLAVQLPLPPGQYQVFRLDDTTFDLATSRPETFRGTPTTLLEVDSVSQGGTIALPPFAYARVDMFK